MKVVYTGIRATFKFITGLKSFKLESEQCVCTRLQVQTLFFVFHPSVTKAAVSIGDHCLSVNADKQEQLDGSCHTSGGKSAGRAQ